MGRITRGIRSYAHHHSNRVFSRVSRCPKYSKASTMKLQRNEKFVVPVDPPYRGDSESIAQADRENEK